jgi:hypothetical protein
MKIQFTFKENDSIRLPIPCPKCGHEQSETLAGLRLKPEVTRAGCGVTIRIDKSEIEAFLDTLKRLAR